MGFGETKSEEQGKAEKPQGSSSGKKPPVARVKRGGVEVAVWENQGKSGGTFHTFSLQRTYKQGEEFKHTSALRVNDLPKAIEALREAYNKALE